MRIITSTTDDLYIGKQQKLYVCVYIYNDINGTTLGLYTIISHSR